MKKKEKDFYEAVNAYNIPVLTLDHNWHKLFGNEEATPAVKVLQEELNELNPYAEDGKFIDGYEAGAAKGAKG